MNQLLCRALLPMVLLAAGASHAQVLVGMGSPSQASAGKPIKLTVSFAVSSGIHCGLRISWGDAVSDTFKITQAGDVPLNVSHIYAKPGSYMIVADPERVGSAPKCGGLNQHAPITIVAAPAKEGPTRLPAPKTKS